MLTAEESFSRYCRAYPIPNKEARTVAKVLVDQHFNVYRLPDQLHSDNGREFVNNLWKELFSEFKIQHTTTPPYNPSSNPVERFQRTIIAMLRTRGEGIQDNWDLWINVSVLAYITTVSSSTGVTPHYAMFRREATLPVLGVSYTFSREENYVSVDGRHVIRKTACVQKYERTSRRKSAAECTAVETVNPEHQSGVSSVEF